VRRRRVSRVGFVHRAYPECGREIHGRKTEFVNLGIVVVERRGGGERGMEFPQDIVDLSVGLRIISPLVPAGAGRRYDACAVRRAIPRSRRATRRWDDLGRIANAGVGVPGSCRGCTMQKIVVVFVVNRERIERLGRHVVERTSKRSTAGGMILAMYHIVQSAGLILHYNTPCSL